MKYAAENRKKRNRCFIYLWCWWSCSVATPWRTNLMEEWLTVQKIWQLTFDTGSVTNSAVSCQQGVLQYLLIHRAWNGILSSKTDNLPSAFCLCWCALISLPRCFFYPHYPPRLGASNSQCTAGRYFMLERWANRGGGRRAGYLKPSPQNLPRCKRTIFINLHNFRDTHAHLLWSQRL